MCIIIDTNKLGTFFADPVHRDAEPIHARIGNLADRVSKVEGIIEGLFWGTRNQPPEKSREGVA